MSSNKKQRGRPSLDKAERIKRKAARDYRAFIKAKALKEEDINANRMGDSTRGRKPLPLKEQISRAKKAFLMSLDEYFIEFDEQKTNLSSTKELLRLFIQYRASDDSGRDAADEVIKLKQFITKKERDIEDIKIQDEPDLDKRSRGPKPMSKFNKIAKYQTEIDNARSRIVKVMSEMSYSDRLKYEIHDLKVERRRLNISFKNNEITEYKYNEYKNYLDSAIAKEEQNKKELEREERDAEAASSIKTKVMAQPLPCSSQELSNSLQEDNLDNYQMNSDVKEKINELLNDKNQNREILIEYYEYLSNLRKLILMKEKEVMIQKEMLELKIKML